MTVYDYGRTPEHWLLAQDIASPVRYADPSDSALEQFEWMAANDFDVAFVTGGAVVFRNRLSGVAEHAKLAEFTEPLPDKHCVPHDLSLSDTFAKLAATPWLVLTDGSQICGIVTPEDLAKPAASAFAFAHLITLERVLRRLVGSYTNQPLGDEPQPPGIAQIAGHAGTGMHHLSHVVNRAGRLPELLAELGYSKSEFRKLGRWAIGFRNHLAHARRLNHDDPQAQIALGRFLQVQKLMLRAIALVEDRKQVWQAFSDSVIRDHSSSTVWAGPGAFELPFSAPCFVITAWNPFEQTLDEASNRHRNQMLLKGLKRRTELIRCVVGQSPCQTWQEESFMVGGMRQADVLELAKRYGQRAVFRLEPNEKLVVDCDGQVRARACRCEP
ncbi:DUF3293 domain-containing protein [Roseimaritima ulvae]|uniref:DUF3293 domain-containing protein n=1 Tax=Roseimaritima ulvae TaxID=980254 RepID=A0A5B9QVJ3_9BACT|nr:DUF3293 domain-containing protein [Roseimaritima ulvae]QEG41972.1 hypothetical protein UC8_40010 [Roseimaritima ulvae]